MAKLTRDQILNVQDLSTEIVDVPEWGGEVTVKAMTGLERDAFEGSLMGTSGSVKIDNIRAKLVQKTVVDEETGKQLFSVADIEMLGGKSAAALDRIFTVARKLSGLSEDDVAALEKNSSPVPTDSSLSN